MNEAIRMEYLEAMGVDMYVPRKVLPGALASKHAILPIAKEPQGQKPEATEHAQDSRAMPGGNQARAKSPSQIAGIIGQLEELSATLKGGASGGSALKAKIETGPTQPSPTEPRVSGHSAAENSAANAVSPHSNLAGESDRQVRFMLNMWQVGPVLIVDSHQPRQAMPTTPLLMNMLRAKGFTGRLPQAEVLRWPVLASEQKASLNAAREMLDSFLAGRLASASINYLWLMGRPAFETIAPVNQVFQERVGQSLNLDNYQVLAQVMPSLLQLLKDPKLKAYAWAAIKDLPLRW